MKFKKSTYSILFIFLSFYTASVFAGGPRAVVRGIAQRWDPDRPVTFRIDNGPVRSSPLPISRDEGAAVVQAAIDAWDAVETADVEARNDGFLSFDVRASGDLNPALAEGNAIIFDADGSLLNSLLGSGSSTNILGVATSFDLTGDNLFDAGYVILNGIRGSTLETAPFFATTVHELGHFLGLDHTEAGQEFFDRCNSFNRDACAVVPIMYPIIKSDAQVNVTPTADDRSWISWLFPNIEGATTTGTIRGHIRRRVGAPFQGAHVTAIPVAMEPGGGFSEMDDGRVSSVSDFLLNFNGEFVLPGLVPGKYVVRIDPLRPTHTGGSGVGPFDRRYIGFPRDYYNADGETGSESDVTEQMVIDVTPLRTIRELNFVSDDQTDPDLSTIEDDDSVVLAFPDGFRFPFYGKRFSATIVNSDGTLTFDTNDISTESRDLPRFLSLARIAPLFTDLDPGPTGFGTVSSRLEGNRFIIEWQGVPEFGGFNGNSFQVSLYENGDIRFHYDSFSVSADSGNLLAIVGVAPGDGRIGSETDLSTAGDSISVGQRAIYQRFRTTGPFDLIGNDVVFVAGDEGYELYFPYFEGDVDEFSGYALTNDSPEDSALIVEGLSPSGDLLDSEGNPAAVLLGSKKQTARLGREFLGISLEDEVQGWMQVTSAQPEIASFFQFGDGLDGSTSQLDGSVAWTEMSDVLYFSRIYDGSQSFPAIDGPRDAVTTLYLANPNDVAISVTLRYFNTMGQEVGNALRAIAAGGCLSEDFGSLFNLGIVSDGHVRVDVEGPGAVGLSTIRLSDTVLGFNASTGNEETTLYSAQLATGTSGGAAVFTSIKLVNTSSSLVNVALSALAADGSLFNVVQPFPLGPGASFQADAGELFQLGPPTGPAVSGSLRVDVTGPGVVGDVVFGEPNDLRYAAALPLQTETFTRGIFSQVANLEGPTPQASTFTGLAFFNPSPATAEITIRVFTEDCQLAGESTISLGANERVSPVLTEVVPGSVGQVRGYIVIESTQVIVAQQLFGNLTLDYLSAVPPSVF